MMPMLSQRFDALPVKADVAPLRCSPSLCFSSQVVVPNPVQSCGLEWAGPEHLLGWDWDSGLVAAGTEAAAQLSEVWTASGVLLKKNASSSCHHHTCTPRP